MSKTSRRRGKLSEEELEEVQNFVYRKNVEEDKFLQSMSVNIKCKNENQKLVIGSIKNNEITIVSGLPGTGKTYLACAEALKLIKTKTKYKKILLVKSVIDPITNFWFSFLHLIFTDIDCRNLSSSTFFL